MDWKPSFSDFLEAKKEWVTSLNYLIGLDIGTSSIKGVLIQEDGKNRFTAKEPFVYTRTEEGGVEISASDYEAACFALLRKFSEQLPADGKLCGICAASASGNLLLLDQKGNPSTPIFNWQDGRVTDECQKILGDFDANQIYERVGWPYDGHTFPLALLCWVKVHQPQLLAECSKVCMSTEYLYYRLTGCWGISGSTGSPFYLIDQKNGCYIPEFLDRFGLTEAQLPPIGKTGDVVGTITPEASALTGLPVGTPVMLGTFDHPSAARGAGVLEEGQMLLSCGTSWVCFFPVRNRETSIANQMITDPFLSPDGCYAGMVSVASLSERIEFYIRRYIASGSDMFSVFASEAAKSQLGAGGLVLDLLSEPDDSQVLKFEKCHIARAIMESTVRLLQKKLDALRSGGIYASSAVMVGGPSENPVWSEVFSQMTGITLRTEHGSYAGSLGAAMVAGISAGLYSDETAAAAALK